MRRAKGMTNTLTYKPNKWANQGKQPDWRGETDTMEDAKRKNVKR